METALICLDTSVLIDYFRKSDKKKSFFYALTSSYSSFAVSVITEYEIYVGSNSVQDKFWNEFFQRVTLFSLDSETNRLAVKIHRELKSANRLLDIPDLLIAATALKNDIALATLNTEHFQRISKFKIISRK